MFNSIRSYLIIVGKKRHAAVMGAILDAHPNIVLAYSSDIMKWVKEKQKIYKDQFFTLLLEDSHQTHQNIYIIPNQWQGKYSAIRIIGNRFLHYTKLSEIYSLIEKLKQVIQKPIKIIYLTDDEIKLPPNDKSLSLIDFYNENISSLLQNPTKHLNHMFDFLNLQTDNRYIQDVLQWIKKQKKSEINPILESPSRD